MKFRLGAESVGDGFKLSKTTLKMSDFCVPCRKLLLLVWETAPHMVEMESPIPVCKRERGPVRVPSSLTEDNVRWLR